MVVSLRALLRICVLITLLIWLGGCASTDKIPENLSDATLYEKGQQALRKEDYHTAVAHLRALESRYPFGPFSTQGQLDLAYAYLKNGEPEEAHAAAGRFIRLHPDHPNADYAMYLQGLSSYKSQTGFAEKYFPVDPGQRDPGPALKSFDEFSALLNRYPDSLYAADARLRMVALRNRMAGHILSISGYYLKRHAYVAAVNRAGEVTRSYSGTPSVEPALGILVESYQHLGMTAAADDALSVLKANYPHSSLLDAHGRFTGYRVFGDVDPSFLSMVTFGLIGGSKKPVDATVPAPPA